MTAALEGGEWSAARSGRTLPPGKTRYPFYRRLGGSQDRSGRAENLVATGIRSRTVQPVVSRYTDWRVFFIETISKEEIGFGSCGKDEWIVRACHIDIQGDMLHRSLLFLMSEFFTACRIPYSVRCVKTLLQETHSVHHNRHLFVSDSEYVPCTELNSLVSCISPVDLNDVKGSWPLCWFNNKEFCVLHVQSNTTIFYLLVQ